MRDGELAIIRIDNPTVNALSADLIADLDAAVAAFEAEPSFAGLVLECVGRTFIAGGDIHDFDHPKFSAARLNGILTRLSLSERPVTVTLFGSVLGGGLELAMAFHYRVAAPEARLGMPEITLGLIPGSLGTQHLPRLAGLALAADLISTGRQIGAGEALAAGIVDVLDADPAARARAEAPRLVGHNPRRVRDLAIPDAGSAATVLARLAEAAEAAEAAPWLPARRAVHDVLAAAGGAFETGAAVEAEAFATLVRSPGSRALRHLFFAERDAGKIPGEPPEAATRLTPTPSSSISQISPCFMKSGGVRASPTPLGVPVTMTSPGVSVKAALRVEIIEATSKIMSLVFASCTVSPLSRAVSRSPAPPGGSASAVTKYGPNAPVPS